MNVRWEVKAVGEWPAAGAGKLGTWEAWRLSGLNAVPREWWEKRLVQKVQLVHVLGGHRKNSGC